MNKAQNPMSEYLLKIQLIVNNTEFKNKAEADKYETLQSKRLGDAYVRAYNKTDIFESYQYSSSHVYQVLELAGYEPDKIMLYLKTPTAIPSNIKNQLLQEARDSFLSAYKESNKYYLMLMGKPYPGDENTPADDIVTIPDEFYSLYAEDNTLERNQPVHEMPSKYQELFMNSEYYQKALREHPDARYLRYIGSNAIPLHISRPAKDGSIMRINTSKLSTYDQTFGNITVSSDIVHLYTKTYDETRKYVFETLRGNFSSIYPNYDSFIRFLTIYLSIGGTLNELARRSTSLIHMNNVTANNFFMLYGLPSVIMEGTSMIEFLKKFRMILSDKATNCVYRVKDIVGYEYTDIYTLVMVKQQVFENGVPLYTYDKETGKKIPQQEIVFRRLGTTEDNTSYFKYRDDNTTYSLDEITSGDPRWWNTPEVNQKLSEMNYTLSNSKYIQLSTHLSMTDIYWQCVILLRGILDRRQETMFTKLNINLSIDGSESISLFEAVLALVVMMNFHMKDYRGNALRGQMYIPNGKYNGRDACLDLMFNGLYLCEYYQSQKQYFKDDLVCRPNEESRVYIAKMDFVSSNIDSDIKSGKLQSTTIQPGAAKELTLGAPYKLTSFDFDLRGTKPEFYNRLSEYDYIEPDVFKPMLDKVLDREHANLGEVLMHDVKNIYTYLETKLRESRTIREFRQVTEVFENLFLVEPERDWYDNTSFNVDAALMDEYNLTSSELASLKTFFRITEEPDLIVRYKNINYPIMLYTVLNEDARTIQINKTYPFQDDGFVTAFSNEMSQYKSNTLEASALSNNIKSNYQNIIIDKVILDTGNSDDGPRTFESLLFRTNPSLYRYLMNLKSDGEAVLFLLRSIVKALENYTNSKLQGLEFTAEGVSEYIQILKEIITYFKSYMVEFTKDEFVYIFDGLFDQGGHSNMLRLYDEIAHTEMTTTPVESLTLYDAGYHQHEIKMEDDNTQLIHDEATFRMHATYQTYKSMGYEILYDDGKRISKTPIDDLEDTTELIGNLITDQDGKSKLILSVDNISKYPPNYYGNAL